MNSDMTVMVADPGQTTGWAVGKLSRRKAQKDGAHNMVREGLVDVGQIGGGTSSEDECQQASELLTLCGKYSVDLIVLEGFWLFPDMHHSSDPAAIAPVRIIARIEAMNWLEGRSGGIPWDITYQTPSEKSVITDDRLRRWSLWQPGKAHANDALRHLCVYARKWA